MEISSAVIADVGDLLPAFHCCAGGWELDGIF
jgi:hypothetical protein